MSLTGAGPAGTVDRAGRATAMAVVPTPGAIMDRGLTGETAARRAIGAVPGVIAVARHIMAGFPMVAGSKV
jgi:hypothetical protein